LNKKFTAGFFVFLVAAAMVYFILYLILPNNRMVPAFDDMETHLVIGGDIIDSKYEPKIVNGEILLPIGVVKERIDPHIYWDEKLKKVTITTQDKVIRMKTDSLNAVINNKSVKLNIPVKSIQNAVYLPIEFLSELYGIKVKYIAFSNVVVVDKITAAEKIAEPIKKVVVRRGNSKHYPIIRKLDSKTDKAEDMKMKVFNDKGKWYKVRTSDGLVGYIEKRLVNVSEVKIDMPHDNNDSKLEWKPEKGKLSLVWEMLYEGSPNLSAKKKIEGLDILSPTWFEVTNTKGDLINRADPKYVQWAHENGYKVWALFSNGFGDIKLTSEFLNDTDARDNAIRQLLAYTALYKLDGINIDFENIYKKDRDALTQFVREVKPLLKQQGLIVSMDITVPDGSETYSLCYDRKSLGEVVDYVMLMAYDQHWRTSPVAGSIAEITWVEDNLEKTLKLIPAEKVILGLPFYTRLWKEEKGKDGEIEVSSSTGLSMKKAKAAIDSKAETVLWDQNSGQFYAEYKEDGNVFKIWYENEDSIDLRSSLTLKYNLAGTAGWSKNNETEGVWQVLNKNLKEIKSYEDWLSGNKDKKYVYNK
jgi:spore germination protein YaaH